MNEFNEGDLVFLKCDIRMDTMLVVVRSGKNKCECLHMQEGRVVLNMIPVVALKSIRHASK